MNQRELVVRIVQPASQPELPRVTAAPARLEKKEKYSLHAIMNGVGLAAIAGLSCYFAFSFFNLGFALNEIMVIVGIPLSVGLVAGYSML